MVREASQPLIYFFPQDKIWFWPRHASDIPSDVHSGNSGSINTDAWDTPTAYFPDTLCDTKNKFSTSNIIIDLTFCESLFRPYTLSLKSVVFRWRAGWL